MGNGRLRKQEDQKEQTKEKEMGREGGKGKRREREMIQDINTIEYRQMNHNMIPCNTNSKTHNPTILIPTVTCTNNKTRPTEYNESHTDMHSKTLVNDKMLTVHNK